jgi:hypothetical protein
LPQSSGSKNMPSKKPTLKLKPKLRLTFNGLHGHYIPEDRTLLVLLCLDNPHVSSRATAITASNLHSVPEQIVISTRKCVTAQVPVSNATKRVLEYFT